MGHVVIIPAMHNSDVVKTRHLILHEWCLFPPNWFQCFKVECLVVPIIKKKSGNSSVMKILSNQNLVLKVTSTTKK